MDFAFSLQLTLLAHEIGHMFGVAVSMAERNVRREFPGTSIITSSLLPEPDATQHNLKGSIHYTVTVDSITYCDTDP